MMFEPEYGQSNLAVKLEQATLLQALAPAESDQGWATFGNGPTPADPHASRSRLAASRRSA